MKFNLKATSLVLPDSIHEYLQKKMSSIEKLVEVTDNDLVKVDIELCRDTRRHRTGDIFRAEINCQIGKTLLRAESQQSELKAAIDLAKDEMVGEIKNYKSKQRTKSLAGARRLRGKGIS